MADLESLPGIGRAFAAELRAVGVRNVEALRELGAPSAAQRLAEMQLREVGHAQRTIEAALGDTAAAQPPITVLGVDNVLFTVGDLDAALVHYQHRLGLPVRFRLPEPQIALLGLGDETPGLLLRADTTVPEAFPTSTSPRVWLEVPDATAAAGRLRAAGAVALGEPFPVATGVAVEFADRWGNVVGLTDYTNAPDRGRAPGHAV